MYKLLDKCPRKFIYQIVGDQFTFLNLLHFIQMNKGQKNAIDAENRIKDFFLFCEVNEIDPYNFLTKNENYKLVSDDCIVNVTLDISRYGLHWRHYIDENVENIDVRNVYNIRRKDNILYYSYPLNTKDFLADYRYDEDEYFVDKYWISVDRQKLLLMQDYLSLALYDFNIKFDVDKYFIIDGKQTYNVITENGKAKAVVKDFEYFYNRNVMDCPVCNKLVDNAFDDYMIQFYKHEGCSYK